MTMRKLKNKQYQYIAAIGGYSSLREHDCKNNDINRDIIKAFKNENKTAFLGFVNLPSNKYNDLRNGKEIDVLEEYTGQRVCNFGADYVISTKDNDLEELIKSWNMARDFSKEMNLLNKIEDRIDELGGIRFIWS